MFSRTIRKSILDIRIPNSTLPPTFLLPNRARFFNATTQHVEPAEGISTTSEIPPTSPIPKLNSKSSPPTAPAPITTPVSLSPSVREMLPLLSAQPTHFITAHIYAKPYLVTAGDTIRLPFRMAGVLPGDILRLNRATSLGSRDYTLKGTPYLDERIFECRARVLGTEAEPLRIKEKTKRRNRKVKTVKSKHKYTVLRIAEVRVKKVEEIEG